MMLAASFRKLYMYNLIYCIELYIFRSRVQKKKRKKKREERKKKMCNKYTTELSNSCRST